MKTLIVKQMSISKVNHTLCIFKLKPDSLSENDKLMLIPFVDDTYTFKQLVITLIERKISNDKQTYQCIMAIGFTEWYAANIMKKFEKIPDCWKLLTLTEWLNAWFDDIIEQL